MKDKKFLMSIAVPMLTFLITSISVFYSLKSRLDVQEFKLEYIQSEVFEIKNVLKSFFIRTGGIYELDQKNIDEHFQKEKDYETRAGKKS